MENSTKKSGGVVIPKRKRSLDLKSLYESRVSEVAEVKNKTSEINHVEDVEKKKRSKKEVSLSSFQPGVNKGKEDVNVEKSETGSVKKSTSGNKGLHGMPPPLADNAAVFNIPKRPRGSVGLKKPESDRKPLRLQESDDRVGPSNVNATKSEIDSFHHEKSINAGAVSAGNGGILKSKSPSSVGRKNLESSKLSKPSAVPDSFDRVDPINLSVTKSKDDSGHKDLEKVVSISGGSGGVTKLHSSGKNSRPNSKSKQKADLKFTFDASGSSQKLKRKAGDEEIKQSKKFKFGSAEKKGNPVVICGNRSSEKQLNNSSKKKDLVLCRDGNDASTMKTETSVHEVEETRNDKVVEEDENLVVNNENSSLEKRRSKGKKRKDSVLDGNGKGTSKKKRGTFVGEVEEKKNDRFGAVCENNEHFSPEKQRRNSRKGKDSLVGGDGEEASTKKTEPSMDGLFVGIIDDDDDLEQNAARMLSSRFDPSCTGFASNKRSSNSDGISFPVSSGRDSVNQQAAANSSGFAETGSADAKSIALRPRGEGKGKQVQRQRRHFYEVLPKDFDALWVVNRRIKIFWPLDESWYHGLVKDYHPEVKLHHIKYDDRDEEWVDLQEEKFKLLLLPSEVPGKTKTRKHKTRSQDVDGVTKEAPPRSDDDDDSGTRNVLDSEPIASWLTLSNQRVKSSRKRISQMHPPTVSSLAANIKEDREPAMVNDLDTEGMVNEYLLQTVNGSRNGTHLFYVRKKFKKNKERSFGRMDAKACGNIAPSLAPEKQMWLTDDKGNLRLNGTEFRIETCLDVLPCMRFSYEREVLWLLHCIFMLQHGTVVIASPAVKMEMLFIDSNHGLRFLLFEGCLSQALAFISLILFLFSRADEQCNGDAHMPVTSISFSVYGGRDLKKRYVFAFCSFSGLKRSKWLYLDYKLLQHCCLLKQLPVSECTHENIKNLEGKRKLVTGILPMGISGDVCNTSMLVEHSFASNDLQFHVAPCSTERPEKDIQPVGETRSHTEPSSVNSEHISPQMNAASGNSLEVFTQLEQDEPMKDVDEQTIGTDPTPNPKSGSRAGSLAVDIPSIDQVADRNVKDSSVDSPSLTGSLKHRMINPITSLGDLSPMWHNGKTNFVQNGFSNGPKKPRTQVRYSMPSSGHNTGARQKTQNQRSLPCKRIRRVSLKRLSEGSLDPSKRPTQKNLESQACGANVLVTQGDRGWRLSGAHVVLEVADRNEWILAVKFSGTTKYTYKVNHVLQPGSTNRYSHAMMWKGGKDWVLEFTDRSQWTVFKELHEECYNRNIRAASVKNIPIPGVRLVEENDGFGRDVSFARNSMKYFRQLQTDVELAMDPSRILYDMDSDDEEWLRANKRCSDKEISDDVFEKTVDMFEKVSCIQQRDNCTEAEIEEIAVGVCSVEVAKLVYGHWRRKRERKGMPLIRHLQPPLWEIYQKQVKEWEQTVSRGNAAAFSSGNQGKGLLPLPEKPPMFAFCLKPRGLDVPSRGSKQRSHRKFLVPGHHHAASGDQDGVLLGRRSGHAFGDEKTLYPLHEYADVSPSFRASKRGFSPLDAHYSLNPDASEWTRNPTSYKNRPKKLKSYVSLNNPNLMPYKNRRKPVQQWKAGLSEMPSGQKRYHLEGKHKQSVAGQLDSSDFNEFQLRDASKASQHARNMAKLKRERAQRLMYRADLYVHKAVTAIMTAEAIKAAHESSNSEN